LVRSPARCSANSSPSCAAKKSTASTGSRRCRSPISSRWECKSADGQPVPTRRGPGRSDDFVTSVPGPAPPLYSRASAARRAAMEDRIRFVTHRGQQVLLVDLSHCNAEELGRLARQVRAYAADEPRGSVLLLADFTGAKFDKAALEVLKQATVFARP